MRKVCVLCSATGVHAFETNRICFWAYFLRWIDWWCQIGLIFSDFGLTTRRTLVGLWNVKFKMTYSIVLGHILRGIIQCMDYKQVWKLLVSCDCVEKNSFWCHQSIGREKTTQRHIGYVIYAPDVGVLHKTQTSCVLRTQNHICYLTTEIYKYAYVRMLTY